MALVLKRDIRCSVAPATGAGDGAADEALARLNKFSNHDKHHIILPTALYATDASITLSYPDSTVLLRQDPVGHVFANDAVLAVFPLAQRSDAEGASVHAHGSPVVSLDMTPRSGIKPEPLATVANQLLEDVQKTVGAFRRFFVSE